MDKAQGLKTVSTERNAFKHVEYTELNCSLKMKGVAALIKWKRLILPGRVAFSHAQFTAASMKRNQILAIISHYVEFEKRHNLRRAIRIKGTGLYFSKFYLYIIVDDYYNSI